MLLANHFWEVGEQVLDNQSGKFPLDLETAIMEQAQKSSAEEIQCLPVSESLPNDSYSQAIKALSDRPPPPAISWPGMRERIH